MTLRALVAILLIAGLAATQTLGTEWRTDVGFQTAYAPAFSGHHVLDSQGNVYATSNAWSYTTGKLDPDGRQLWTRSVLGGTGTQSLDLAVDSQDNVVVAGYQEGIGGGFLTTKYDPDGNTLWSVITSHGLSDEGFRVAIDAADNIYVTGRSFTPLFAHIYQTVKFAPDGNELWFDRFEHFGGEPRAIDVTPDGRVMVTGDSANLFGTICYDTDGGVLWWDTFPGLDGAEHGVITPAGDVYVSGTAIVGSSIGAVLHYSPSGTLEWVGTYNTPGSAWDRYRRLAVHSDGSVVAVGQGGPGYLSWSVVRFNSNGDLAWAVAQPDSNSNDGWATDVALDAAGAAYVTGFASYGSFGSFVRSVAIKYDALGNEVWNYPIPCSGYSGSIALDQPSGAIIVSSGSMVSRVGTEPVPVLLEAVGTPVAVGGQVQLDFTAFDFPGAYHIAAASFGTSPGISTSFGHVPLNFDALMQLSVDDPTGTFLGFTGEIDCEGRTTASIQLPANPTISGIQFYVAYVAFPGGIDPGDPGISNAVLIEIQ